MSHATLCFLSYERPAFLRTAVESAIAHADEPVEIIIHDDGSTDPELLKLLYTWHQRGVISLVMLGAPGVNLGQGVALNRMFRAATGDPILKCDQDLVFKPDWLKEARRILESAPLEGTLWPVFSGGEVVAYTLVDDDMVDLMNRYVWRLQANGYVVRQRGDDVCYLHRTVAASTIEGSSAAKSRKSQQADHKSRIRLDNRRCNLRIVEKSENNQNVPAQGGTSRFRGVSWSTTAGKWCAQWSGTPHAFIGYFTEEHEAAAAVEAWRRENRPFATPDPLLFDDYAPAIGMLGLHRYHADPVDCAKTIIGRRDGWERHTHICGCAFAMTRRAWETMGSFEEHSEAFSEDFVAQQWVTASGLWCCALPERSLVDNQGFGLGPSTVVVQKPNGDLTSRKIHQLPKLVGRP